MTSYDTIRRAEQKVLMYVSKLRVLRAEGELLVADFGRPQNIIMYLISLVTRSMEEVLDNVKGLLPEMFRSTGFNQVAETSRFMTAVGTVSIYKALKPA